MKEGQLHIPSCQDCTNDSKIFCALSALEKEALSENKGSNYYKKGQNIFYQGNYSHGLYCIYSGKVKLSKLGEDGKEQVIRFAGTGDILGYRALLSNEPYQATATAMEDCYVCHLAKDNCMALINENSDLSLNIIRQLTKDLRNAEQHLINLAQKTVKERISESILHIHDTFGFKEDGKTLNVALSRSEIADIAGTTTETAIRTLSQLNKEGVIDLVAKSIVIPDIKRLAQEANFLG
ncbi:MAG: Crp/Fnr family transcriptional regulator [Crocinitomicaceae bacterium]|nr:Crp/Fnr family transcriptional regulator [Crocinitomicaceae bacterium]